MRVWLLVGLIVLSGCELFRPNYYEGTCLDANGKEITRYVYPIPTPLPTGTAACNDRRRITLAHQADWDKKGIPRNELQHKLDATE
jgi:hypothetical protein